MAEMKVLVVDDSPTMRKIVAAQLGQLGYGDVEQAENGEEALEVLKRASFDLVLTDWNMPVMDGRALVENIRQTEALKEIPVLMVTTRNTKADVILALQAGVNNFVVKPFKPADLGKKISAVLPEVAA